MNWKYQHSRSEDYFEKYLKMMGTENYNEIGIDEDLENIEDSEINKKSFGISE